MKMNVHAARPTPHVCSAVMPRRFKHNSNTSLAGGLSQLFAMWRSSVPMRQIVFTCYRSKPQIFALIEHADVHAAPRQIGGAR